MRKNRFWALICGCFVLTSLLEMASVPGYCQTIELNYSILFPATHGQAVLAAEWAKEVEKRTNGVVKIHMFPGATLTPADQCYDGVVKGISDIGMSVLSYSKGRFPLTEVIDLPLGYKSANQATLLCNSYYKKFKPKEFDDVKVLYLHAHGPGILHTKKPITKLEDLKGLKIRGSGTSAKVAAALGGTPVAMPVTETYDALQKGVADGVLLPVEALKGWKFAEVIKSTTMDYGAAYTLALFTVMNKKKWESLPKEAQDVIEKINEEWIINTAKMWDKLDKDGMEFTLSKGNKVLPLPKEEDERWAGTVRPVLDEYVAAMKARSLPGQEALSFSQEWLNKNP